MSKKLFLIFSLLVIASMLLAACGPAATEAPVAEEPAAEEPAAEEPVAEPTEEPMEEPTEEPMEEPAAGPPAECADNADFRTCAVFGPDDNIKIGYAGPMTGDYSAFGTDISEAGLIAIQDAEPLEGRSFELLIQDTQGGGEGGAAVANLYVSDPGVVAIAGHTFSGSTAAAIPIYNEARLPMLSPSATRADLTEGDQDVFNRIPFTDDIQGTKAAEYMYNVLGFTSIAVMHDGDAYGQGLAEKVREVFESLGGTVVAFEPITPGEADYSSVLNAIAAQSPEAIYYGGYDAEAAVIKNQMGVAGMPDAVFFSDDGTFGTNFLDLTGANAEGAYAASALPPESELRDSFEASFSEAYGREAGSLSTFSWHGYDIVAALIEAIKEVAIVGEDGNLYIPREALVDAVRGLSGFAGTTGDISCNETGECNTAGPTFMVVQDGAWVPAAGQ